jgi:hypothetical protein
VAPKFDETIITPAHYSRYAVEPIEFIMINELPFHVGSIIKYACRAGYKMYEDADAVESEITDLNKIIRYCQMRINQLNEEGIL